MVTKRLNLISLKSGDVMSDKKLNAWDAKRVLKELGIDKNTEITRYKGHYYVLHICPNGNPAPEFYHKDIKEVIKYLDRYR